MAVAISTAKGRFRTFNEGVQNGNMTLAISVHDINGAWPGLDGGQFGAEAVLSVWGAALVEDTGTRQTYQGTGRFVIVGPDGEILFSDELATIFYTTDESSIDTRRPEVVRRVSVSGFSPQGQYGALTLGEATVDDMAASEGELAMAHVSPAAPGALKRALRT